MENRTLYHLIKYIISSSSTISITDLFQYKLSLSGLQIQYTWGDSFRLMSSKCCINQYWIPVSNGIVKNIQICGVSNNRIPAPDLMFQIWCEWLAVWRVALWAVWEVLCRFWRNRLDDNQVTKPRDACQGCRVIESDAIALWDYTANLICPDSVSGEWRQREPGIGPGTGIRTAEEAWGHRKRNGYTEREMRSLEEEWWRRKRNQQNTGWERESHGRAKVRIGGKEREEMEQWKKVWIHEIVEGCYGQR